MEGGCFCGAVRYRIDGTLGRVTSCHCLHCRRTTGAPFVTWVEVEPSRFSIVGGTPSRYSSRPGVTRTPCPRCGTQLTYEQAGHIVVDRGSALVAGRFNTKNPQWTPGPQAPRIAGLFPLQTTG